MNLTVKLSKDTNDEMLPQSLVYDLKYDLEKVKNALASLTKDVKLIIQNAPPQ